MLDCGADLGQNFGTLFQATAVTGPLAERLRSVSRLKPVRWGEGIYGRFTGPELDGKLTNQVQPN